VKKEKMEKERRKKKMVVSLLPQRVVTDHAPKRAVGMNGRGRKSVS